MAKIQRVKVVDGFVLGPDEYAAPGSEIDLPLAWAIRERAAGTVKWLDPQTEDEEPGITKVPGIEHRDPKPDNRDPKARR